MLTTHTLTNCRRLLQFCQRIKLNHTTIANVASLMLLVKHAQRNYRFQIERLDFEISLPLMGLKLQNIVKEHGSVATDNFHGFVIFIDQLFIMPLELI